MSKQNPIREPQQARSQKTMNQILDTAAAILEQKTFDQLTVSEVVHQAGTSVGAFYGRFRNKQALLQALDERFFQRFEQDFEELQLELDWDNQTITTIIHDTAKFLVEVYRRDTGVLRSLNLKARLSDDSQFKAREKNAWDTMYPQLQRRLLQHAACITHQDPDLAVRFGFRQMFFSIREFLLWGSLRENFRYDLETLSNESARAFLSYLGVEEQ